MSIPPAPSKPPLDYLRERLARGNQLLAEGRIQVGTFSMLVASIRHSLFQIFGAGSPAVDAMFPTVNPKALAATGQDLRPLVERSLQRLQSVISSIDRALMSTASGRVFIGHGRSPEWLRLKEFITNRLGLSCDEFNQEVTAGLTTAQRLEDMLAAASFAFLIMTAEDEAADSSMRARPNVIHEIGLFQGRLGFDRAIILLEHGCQEFSNIHGLTQLRFPSGDIAARFEDVRLVLEARGLLR